MNGLHQLSTLWMLLISPLAAATCSSTFYNGIKNLHALKKTARVVPLTIGGVKTNGYNIDTTSLSPISLSGATGASDLGCNRKAIDKVYALRLRVQAGDKISLFAHPRGSGDYQIRQARAESLEESCPGIATTFTFGEGNARCAPSTHVAMFDLDHSLEFLILLQPAAGQKMNLWWAYTPNPLRKIDSCELAKNGKCDYDSGKCLAGTDCTDCGGTGCTSKTCLRKFPYATRSGVPATCDDPKWKFLIGPAVDVIGSPGPWDCKSLEREMRMDCSGCRCETKDPCTDEVKAKCKAENRKTCKRGKSQCGECLERHTLTGGICKPDPCSPAAIEACKLANKQSCTKGSFKCGPCLEGFGKVSSICVDISKCKNSNVPSKMVMLMDTSGSLDNPLYLGRYGNFAELKSFAQDLVNVFPINEFAIRSFSNTIIPYPASGAFVRTKAEAVANIKAMKYQNGATYTGKALEDTIKLLEDETDSFNMVMVFTDGQATDGTCKDPGQTCNPVSQYCEPFIGSSRKSCKLAVQAPKLKALPDRNATVTVVSVGFGRVNEKELKLISSGDDNAIIAQGKDASDGLAALERLLGKLVEKVCLNLPVDCKFTYTEWSPCEDECGLHYQFRRVDKILVESKNGGKACPSRKAMLKRYARACPILRECTVAPTTTPTTTTTTAAPATTVTIPVPTDAPATDAPADPTTKGSSGDGGSGGGSATTSKGSGGGEDSATKEGSGDGEEGSATTEDSGPTVVDAGTVVNVFALPLLIACSVAMLFV